MGIPRLADYDVPSLIDAALKMDDTCSRGTCAAPTIHILAHLLREATSPGRLHVSPNPETTWFELQHRRYYEENKD